MATWQFNRKCVETQDFSNKMFFYHLWKTQPSTANHAGVTNHSQLWCRNEETVKQACQNIGPNVHNVPLGRSTINRNPGGRTVQFSDSFLRVWFQLLRVYIQKTLFSIKFVFLTINKYFALTIVFYSKLLYQTIKYLNIYQYIILVIWWVYPRPS